MCVQAGGNLKTIVYWMNAFSATSTIWSNSSQIPAGQGCLSFFDFIYLLCSVWFWNFFGAFQFEETLRNYNFCLCLNTYPKLQFFGILTHCIVGWSLVEESKKTILV